MASRADKKQQQGMEFLLSLLGETGQQVEKEDLQKAIDEPVVKHDFKMLQAEGVLLHLTNEQKTMQHKYCVRCKEVFSTRYVAVAYCSDLCRRMAMEEFGIVWNPRTDSYRNMEAERPIVVGAEAHAVVLKAAQRFLEDQNVLVKEVPTRQEESLGQDFGSPDGPASEIETTDPDTNPEILPQPSSSLSLDFLESPFHS